MCLDEGDLYKGRPLIISFCQNVVSNQFFSCKISEHRAASETYQQEKIMQLYKEILLRFLLRLEVWVWTMEENLSCNNRKRSFIHKEIQWSKWMFGMKVLWEFGCLPPHAMQRTGTKYRLEASDGEYMFCITIIKKIMLLYEYLFITQKGIFV